MIRVYLMLIQSAACFVTVQIVIVNHLNKREIRNEFLEAGVNSIYVR